MKPFEIILTLAEYEKGKIKCPKCGGKHVHQEARRFLHGNFEEILKDVRSALMTSSSARSQSSRS